MGWILRQRFHALLVALLATMVVYPIFERYTTTRIVFDLFRSFFFLTAFVIIFEERRQRLLAFAIGIPTMSAAWAYDFFDPPPIALDVVFHLSAAAALAVTMVTILRMAYRRPEIDADSVSGALCGYLLLGAIFGHLYTLLDALDPGSFLLSEEAKRAMQTHDRGHYVLTYYSVITLTTVGYGDVVPATSATRSLAMLEAVLGQFYIAVLVADLIGKSVSQAVGNRHSQDPDS